MTDALATFNPKDSNSIWLKFKDGDEIKLRILTLDPLITEKVWDSTPDKIDTKYAFTIWNWTEGRAQVWQVTPAMLGRLTKIHRDEDFDPLNKIDLKVSATGEKLERRYEVNILPRAQNMSTEALEEVKNINLEALLPNNKGRLSEYDDEAATPEPPVDVVHEPTDEPIDLKDIPF